MDGGGSGRGHRERRTTWRTSPPPPTPTFFFSFFPFLRRAIGGHDQQMGMWRGGKEQEGQLRRERDGGDKGGDGWRAGGGTEAWRAASDGAARAEKQREWKSRGRERMMKCSRAGKVVRWSERAGGRLKRLSLLHRFHCKVEFFSHCRLIINKQPPIRSG